MDFNHKYYKTLFEIFLYVCFELNINKLVFCYSKKPLNLRHTLYGGFVLFCSQLLIAVNLMPIKFASSSCVKWCFFLYAFIVLCILLKSGKRSISSVVWFWLSASGNIFVSL